MLSIKSLGFITMFHRCPNESTQHFIIILSCCGLRWLVTLLAIFTSQKHSDEIFSSQLNWSTVNVEKGWIGNRRFQELMGNPKIKNTAITFSFISVAKKKKIMHFLLTINVTSLCVPCNQFTHVPTLVDCCKSPL